MTSTDGHMREVYPVGGESYRYRIADMDGLFTIEVEGEGPTGPKAEITIGIESRQAGEGLCRTQSGRTHPFAWAWVGTELHLWLDGQLFVFERAETRRRGGAENNEASGDIVAPMPGAVLEVLVGEGERVEAGQTILLLESMKMELAITAPRSGVVRRVAVQPGQQVERGMRLVELEGEG
ncbi:MAG: acetyl-CoA carboxylase biotin carboxyl carrier protein subunit [Chloroflexi bacterium]|nr:acetyl-CoA carboxylase biotin carboxyl carrier protein subunit [Chloroflexota bacterium]